MSRPGARPTPRDRTRGTDRPRRKPTLGGWHRRKRHASCAAPGTRSPSCSTSSSATCCRISMWISHRPAVRRCGCSTPPAATGGSCSSCDGGSAGPASPPSSPDVMSTRRCSQTIDDRSVRTIHADALTHDWGTQRSTSWSAIRRSCRRWRPPPAARLEPRTGVGPTPTPPPSSSPWRSGSPDPDGGRVGLVLPQSIIGARDAGPVRAQVGRRCRSGLVVVGAAPAAFRRRGERLRARVPAAVDGGDQSSDVGPAS